jgi:hypothetical protein
MTVRTIHWGTGAMGVRALALAAQDPSYSVAGVVSVRGAARAEEALAEAAPQLIGSVAVGGDLADVVAQSGGADVVLLATSARIDEFKPQMLAACRLGLHVVCIGEDATYPHAVDADAAVEIDEVARAHGVCVIGTGVNPGYVMDFLALLLTAPIRCWKSIHVRRVSDLSDYGETVLHALGVGLTREEFATAVSSGEVGHVGFHGSVAFLADGLGVSAEVVRDEAVPITRDVTTTLHGRELPAGVVVGVSQQCEAITAEGQRIVLEHPQRAGTYPGEEEPHDFVEIDGEPGLRLRVSPGLDGAAATVGLLVNLAHVVVEAPPGFQTMASVPLAAALGRARALQRRAPAPEAV